MYVAENDSGNRRYNPLESKCALNKKRTKKQPVCNVTFCNILIWEAYICIQLMKLKECIEFGQCLFAEWPVGIARQKDGQFSVKEHCHTVWQDC